MSVVDFFTGIAVGSVVAAIIIVTAVLMTITRLLVHMCRAATVATGVQNEPTCPNVHPNVHPHARPNDYEIPVRTSPAQPKQQSAPEQPETQFSSYDQPPAYSTIDEFSTVEPPPPYPTVKDTIPATTADAKV